MIAASIVLYIGLGIISAITVWNHWDGTLRATAQVGRQGPQSNRTGRSAGRGCFVTVFVRRDVLSTHSPLAPYSGRDPKNRE